MLLTGGDDLDYVRSSAPDGFFDEHVFAGLRGAEDPFLAQPGGQRDVNGVNVSAGEQRLVAVHRFRHDRMRRAGLAFGDESLRPREIAAGHGHERGISGITNGLPVLAGDESGTEDAPAAGGVGHELDSVCIGGFKILSPASAAVKGRLRVRKKVHGRRAQCHAN